MNPSPALDIEALQRFHFVGIGGIGMSGLAEILLQLGRQVSGSDARPGPLLERLQRQGATIFTGHRAAQAETADAVVFSSAIPDDNPELQAARRRRLPLLHRGQLLAALLNPRKGISVCGTHGKTTTAAMIGLLLWDAGLDPTLAIGARLPPLGSNARLGSGPWMVAEADESDRSFLELSPLWAVITNIDLDHLDEYADRRDLEEAFLQYAQAVPEQGRVIACLDDSGVRALLKKIHRPVITYGLSPGADVSAQQIETGWFRSTYDCREKDRVLGQIELSVPGLHNVLNSLAAVATGRLLDLSFDVIRHSLAGFRGAERRLQWKGEKGGVWVIDDYGHHPAEVKVTLEACRMTGRRLMVVFQPHRYSRTQYLMRELSACFGEADRLYLLDIYAAGEPPIPGVTSAALAARIQRHREVRHFPDWDRLLATLRRETQAGDLLLTLGAGNVVEIGERFLEEAP